MVLDWPTNGFRVRFRKAQKAFSLRNRAMSLQHESFIDQQITDLLQLRAIEATQTAPKCVSPLGVVPKKNGKLRLIINLRRLNQNVVAPRFRYENISSLPETVQPGDWCTSIDLRNGFYHVPIHPESRPYLGFAWRGNFYQFRVLPFGLAVSPWAFTKKMRQVLKHVRASLPGRAASYVDDWLLVAASKEASDRLTGLIGVNRRIVLPAWSPDQQGEVKPVPGTEHQVPRHGDPHGRSACSHQDPGGQTPNDQEVRTGRILRQAEEAGTVPTRTLAQLAGRITAATKAAAPARLMLRAVYRDIGSATSWSSSVRLSPQSRKDLLRIRDQLQDWNGRYLSIPTPSIAVTTDASDYGWGMVTSSGMKARDFGHGRQQCISRSRN
eukprot:scpid46822/ scgid14313/ Transposon Ty3-I Gag-Pol polyprotein; Gag3-Pol3; Transposon Ty3-2 TYA-TYB polyprotein; Capsid protein; p24; Spacer peptide p3; Nucleocapsid protein p11; Ty3 protease; p16; Spacer peptide J; Reverse transcriptase/ribonuclease H; p55; Integrase p52; Integrase p49